MSPFDIIAWPCGHWCFREELPDHSHKSDDFEVVTLDDDRYAAFVVPLDVLPDLDFDFGKRSAQA